MKQFFFLDLSHNFWSLKSSNCCDLYTVQLVWRYLQIKAESLQFKPLFISFPIHRSLAFTAKQLRIVSMNLTVSPVTLWQKHLVVYKCSCFITLQLMCIFIVSPQRTGELELIGSVR